MRDRRGRGLEGERRSLKRERRRSVPNLPKEPRPEPPSGEEKPRDVFLAACAELARRFEPHGFSYAKSGPHISRRRGDLAFEVGFASSHYNVAGGHVALTLYAGVRSKRLRKWRLEQGSREVASDRVAGGMLQNLKPGTPLAMWDVADPSSRGAVLDDVEHAIREAALPYFALFEDDDALVRRLKHEVVPCFYPLDAIEWLLSQGKRDAAVEHATALLRNDHLRRQYERVRKQIERGEMDLNRLSPIMEEEGLAYAALTYGLDYERRPRLVADDN